MAKPNAPVKKKRLRLSFEAWTRLGAKIDPKRSCLSRKTRLLYSLNGRVHSVLVRVQERSFAAELVTCVPPPPVFILGFWRSGTTFLHELLCCDTQFGFASTYACLNPSHFLLTERATGKGKNEQYVRRPMDNMLYSWSSPQEDEFALLALGAPSPYEALLAPSLMRNPQLLLDLHQSPIEEQERWSASLQLFLRLLTLQQSKPMLLKSPSHGFRFSSLRALFPKARYIIIERNPYELFASNLKLWRTLLELYSLEQFSLEEIEAFVLAAYVIHERSISEGTSDLNQRCFARVRYEDLVANPSAELARLYRELDLGDFETVRPAVKQHLSSVGDYKPNRLTLSLQQRSSVDDMWGTFVSEKGYEWPVARLTIGQSEG